MAMPIVTMSLPVNVFMTALVAKAFILPKTTIGLISALPFVGNFLQIFIAPFLARWKSAKTITVLAAVCHLPWTTAHCKRPSGFQQNSGKSSSCCVLGGL